MIVIRKERQFFLIVTVLVGLMGYINVHIALAATLALIGGLIYSLNPLYCLGTFILIAPFSYTSALNAQLAGIPGLKIPNIILLLSLLFYWLSKSDSRIKITDLAFMFGVALLLSISVVRSIPDLYMINQLTGENLDEKRYIFSYLIRPITYMIPLFIISAYIRSDRDIDAIVKIILISIGIFSVSIIFIYLFDVTNKLDYFSARRSIGSFFNVHTNELANFYILSFPLVLANYLYKRNKLSLFVMILLLAGTGLLFSRTAYILLPISALILLMISQKKRFIPAFLVLSLAIFLISPGIIRERSMYGFMEGDLNQVTAGRVERIWNPLTHELRKNPFTIFAGKGRHGVLLSSSAEENHAHNMYLSMLFETGVVGIFFLGTYFLFLLRKIGKSAFGTPANYRQALLQGVFVSVLAYMISGLTGRYFFPYIGNLYFWIIVGIGLSIIRNNPSTNESYE